MTKDLTRGAPLPLMLRFLVPMLLGNLFQQVYSLTDMIIVGRFLGVDALAGIGATGSLGFLIMGFVFGIAGGFSIPIARAYGAKDLPLVRKTIVNALYLSLALVLVMTPTVLLSLDAILRLIQTPDNIFDDAYRYIFILFAGMGISMFYNILANISRALGDSKTPLYFLIIASFLNVGLDLLFLLSFDLGLAGAAYATIFAQLVSAILCLLYMWRKFHLLTFSRADLPLNLPICQNLFYIGLPMGLQMSITAIGAIILQSSINALGTNVVSAVTVGSRVHMLFFQPIDMLGLTIATFCSQNLGARKLARISYGVKVAMRFGLLLSLALSLTMFLFGPAMARLFLDDAGTAVMPEVTTFLRINASMHWVLAILLILRNAIQGLGFSFFAMGAGVLELVGRTVMAVFFVEQFGFLAVCLAGPVAWALGAAFLVPLYFRSLKLLRGRLFSPSSPLDPQLA